MRSGPVKHDPAAQDPVDQEPIRVHMVLGEPGEFAFERTSRSKRRVTTISFTTA